MQSTDEPVPQDLDAVAEAIRDGIAEQEVSQRELARRSHVSTSTIVDLLNKKRRRYRPQTLESLSKGIGRPPGYLAAIMAGETPPDPADPTEDDGKTSVAHQLTVLTSEVVSLRREIKNLNRKLFTRRH